MFFAHLVAQPYGSLSVVPSLLLKVGPLFLQCLPLVPQPPPPPRRPSLPQHVTTVRLRCRLLLARGAQPLLLGQGTKVTVSDY